MLAAALVVVAAFWSYRMSYAMTDRRDAAKVIKRQIAHEREAIAVLRAEWAYLNSPERLERLAKLHDASLGLGPMSPKHFAGIEEIDPPQPDDGMEPVAIIGFDDVAPKTGAAPAPAWRPARVSSR